MRHWLRFCDRLVRIAVIAASPLLVYLLIRVAWPGIDFPVDQESLSAYEQQAPVPISENAFNAIIALYAPADIEDTASYGAAAVQRINEFMSTEVLSGEFSDLTTFDLATEFGLKELPQLGSQPGLCALTGCLELARTSPEQVEELLRQHSIVLDRAKSLPRYRFYHYTIEETPAHPFVFNPAIHASRLVRSEIALNFSRGETEVAVIELAKQIEHWRRILVDTDRIIGIAHVSSVLEGHLFLAADLIRETSEPEVVAVLEQAISPLTGPERDLCEQFKKECRRAANHWRPEYWPRDGIWIDFFWRGLRAFFSPSRSSKAYDRRVQALCGLSKLSGQDYLEALRDPDSNYIADPVIDYVLNPVGIRTADLHATLYRDYETKLRDLDGLFRLANAHAALRRMQANPENIASLITKLGPEHRDPYDGNPPDWDPETGELVFEGRATSYWWRDNVFRIRVF